MDGEDDFSLMDRFAAIEDPRLDRKKLHPLPDILFITLCAMVCGAESWRDIEDFGESKREFFQRYLALENGIPSKSTFARVFSLLDPSAFHACFQEWSQSLSLLAGEVVAIDGKCLRRSFDNASERSAIHLVSAFAAQSRLVLGQQKVAEKSNEITAIPELLKLLSLQGATVTIDAMGCQKAIAQQIVERGANYVLALKGNQPDLLDDVKTFLDSEATKPAATARCHFAEQTDAGHGRVEVRRAWVSDQLAWRTQCSEWTALQSVVLIESERHVAGRVTTERRYYVSSLPADASQHLATVRAHWAIENSLHWILDMTFREDESRIRDHNAAENIATVRRVALNLLQKAKPHYGKTMSIKRLRKNAGWRDKVLADIVTRA